MKYEFDHATNTFFRAVNKTKLGYLFLRLFFAFCLWSNPCSLLAKENNVQVSLLTCSSGDQIYTTFGHSALRVQLPKSDKDFVYDFGIFDFNTPNFLFKFLKGDLNYRLSIRNFESFINEYKRANRYVIEQKLNFSTNEAYELIKTVSELYNSDGRYYRYNFLYDNCSTRLRELIFNTKLDAISYEKEEQLSYRDNLKTYLKNKPWVALGIDLLLGAPTDRFIDVKQQMYLPYQLSENLEKFKITVNGVEDGLVEAPEIIYQASRPKLKQGFFTPLVVFWGLFIILGVALLFQPRWVRFVGPIVYIAYGLIGVVVAFMWFGTLHDATKFNWNILWANPLFLISPFLFKGIFGLNYLRVVTTICLLFMVTWTFIPQYFNMAILPMLLLLVLINSMAIQLKKETSITYP